MSSTRPSIQRSPSSSRWPVSPVWYQPSRIAFASASGRFQYPPNASSEERWTRDLAVVVEAEPRVDGGPAGAAGLAPLVAPDRERVDLGRAVVVDEHLRPEDLDAAADESRRHRGARVAERPHRREVVAVEVGVVDEVVEERRREVEGGDPLLLDQRERLRRRPSAPAARSSRRRDASRAGSGCPSCGRAASRRACGRPSRSRAGAPATRRRRGRRDASAARPSGGPSSPTCRAAATARARLRSSAPGCSGPSGSSSPSRMTTRAPQSARQ